MNIKKINIFKNKKILVGIIIGLIVIIFIGSKIFGKKQSVSYQTAKAERGNIISTISVSGQIINSSVVNINTQASGVVKQVFVKNGQTVKQGDKLIELTLDAEGQQRNNQAWASYLSAKNTLDAAQATAYSLQSTMFTNWKTFFDLATNSTYQKSDGSPDDINRVLPQFHIAQDDWLASEAKYKNQQSVIIQTQVALNNAWITYLLSSSTVTSPIDGTIDNIVVIPGMIINGSSGSSSTTTNAVQSQQLAVIQNESKPIASFNLSEVDVGSVKSGQKATVIFDSQPGKTFTGEVMTVDRIGAVSSGVTSYPVIIQLNLANSQILPNMAATANIITNNKNNVLLVPSSAIQNSGSQNYARVLVKGKEQNIPVEIGLISDSQTEIVSGIKEGDTVITGTTSNGQSSGNTTSPFSSGFGGAGRAGNTFRLGR